MKTVINIITVLVSTLVIAIEEINTLYTFRHILISQTKSDEQILKPLLLREFLILIIIFL